MTSEFEPEVRVALDLEDFHALVRGQEVQRPGVRIILRDIGWLMMLHEINAAIREASQGEAPTTKPEERPSRRTVTGRELNEAWQTTDFEPDRSYVLCTMADGSLTIEIGDLS